MKGIKLFGLMVLLVITAHTSYGQEEQTVDYRKNVVHGTFGTWLFYIDGKLSYERIFKKQVTKINHTVFHGAQFSIGGSESFEYGTYGKLSANYLVLTGAGKSHFELNAGLNFYPVESRISGLRFNESDDIININTPNVALGYRFQNMQKSRFVFRTGIGWPTGLYVSAGWNF